VASAASSAPSRRSSPSPVKNVIVFMRIIRLILTIGSPAISSMGNPLRSLEG
jgi:hypothetical protein